MPKCNFNKVAQHLAQQLRHECSPLVLLGNASGLFDHH